MLLVQISFGYAPQSRVSHTGEYYSDQQPSNLRPIWLNYPIPRLTEKLSPDPSSGVLCGHYEIEDFTIYEATSSLRGSLAEV